MGNVLVVSSWKEKGLGRRTVVFLKISTTLSCNWRTFVFLKNSSTLSWNLDSHYVSVSLAALLYKASYYQYNI